MRLMAKKRTKKIKSRRKSSKKAGKRTHELISFLAPSYKKLKLSLIILFFTWLLPDLFSSHISMTMLRNECALYSSIEETFSDVVISCIGSFGKVLILDIVVQLLATYLLACFLVSYLGNIKK